MVAVFGVWFGQLQWRTHLLGYETFTHRNIPTVLLAGYGGDAWTYNGMMQRYASAQIAHGALRINVSKSGKFTITQTGKLTDNPLVQVLFADNKNFRGEQAQLLPVLATLKAKYHWRQMNLVGHSMGGGVALNTLLAITGKTEYPQVAKFVGIASPFTGLGKTSDPKRVAALTTQLRQLPAGLSILNLAGDVFGTGGDLEVASPTVFGLKQALPNNIRYRQVLISGDILTSEHSFLHENAQVDGLIAHFLWQ
ncbi:hypothetical protein FC34_GL000499 [Lacticaseibacillus brantae DSM 23927]|uniref:Alpha beta hydrolase superfamily protein n=1 Tax=Lacticaseibacillus brantae DSM 23927 TaxID=1423727 RepID=A0A0R2B4B8_9LACO|nr:hypothetical protein FC34_GL000499 [Lacticaseibacillus brantae DSM 23927]